jgi:2-keto-4-pentenoate hydratase/2-oxohepta-3-ene-1,7-dioic acid hydratase in catechol pathway
VGRRLIFLLAKLFVLAKTTPDHIQEMNGRVPADAVFFMKPSSSIASMTPRFSIPTGCGECHHEVERVLLIGRPLSLPHSVISRSI